MSSCLCNTGASDGISYLLLIIAGNMAVGGGGHGHSCSWVWEGPEIGHSGHPSYSLSGILIA